MVDFLRHIRDLDQNFDPLRLGAFGRYCRSRNGQRAIELNSAHFHPEIVSLPQCLIPKNIAPPAPGGADDVWRPPPETRARFGPPSGVLTFLAANCPLI